MGKIEGDQGNEKGGRERESGFVRHVELENGMKTNLFRVIQIEAGSREEGSIYFRSQ